MFLGRSVSQLSARRMWCLSLCIVMLASTASWVFFWCMPRSTSPSLWVSADSLNFGTAVEQTDFSWEIPITNTTDLPLTISRLERSCTCTSLQPPSLTIAPYTKAKIHLVIDLTKLPAQGPSDELLRDFSTTVRAIIAPSKATPQQAIEWHLNGRIKRYLAPTPMQITFETPLVQGAAHPSREIQITSDESVRELEITGGRPEIKVDVQVNPSNSRRFHITARPLQAIPIGNLDCSLSIFPVLKDGTKGPLTRIPIVGAIVGDISLSPPTLYFGKVPLQTPASGEVCLTSLTNQPFIISTDSGNNLTAECRSSEPAVSHTLRVTLTPECSGTHSCRLTGTIHYPSLEREFPLVIPCGYFGID